MNRLTVNLINDEKKVFDRVSRVYVEDGVLKAYVEDGSSAGHIEAFPLINIWVYRIEDR